MFDRNKSIVRDQFAENVEKTRLNRFVVVEVLSIE